MLINLPYVEQLASERTDFTPGQTVFALLYDNSPCTTSMTHRTCLLAVTICQNINSMKTYLLLNPHHLSKSLWTYLVLKKFLINDKRYNLSVSLLCSHGTLGITMILPNFFYYLLIAFLALLNCKPL